MASPKKNAAYTFAIGLLDTAAPTTFKVNPTLAVGDFKVDIDGAGFTNLATTPTVEPAGGRRVKIPLSAAEMNGDVIMVQGVDAAGGEWNEVLICITPDTKRVSDVDTTLGAAGAGLTALPAMVLDEANAIETGWTLRKILRIVAAALGGKLSGAATATVTIRDVTDTKARITATVDADGNRTAVTLDGT